MISLKKLIESNREELLRSTLNSYRATLAAMGDSAARACPAAGSSLQSSLRALCERLSDDAQPGAVAETGQRIEADLQQWGEHAAAAYCQSADEFREILTMLARAAEAMGERDQRYTGQFNEITARLSTFAGLKDLAEIRESLLRGAAELKACVDGMARQGRESVAELRAELSVYQTRLEEAERAASSDALTGLASRRRLEVELERRAAQGGAFCVMLLDLNEFKQINDRHGHLAGDEILRQFAAELRAAFRASDLVGRWGGDEFLAILGCGLKEAIAQSERVRERVCGDYSIRSGAGARKLRVASAIGIAASIPGECVTEMLRRADFTMYQDKAQASDGKRSTAQPALR